MQAYLGVSATEFHSTYFWVDMLRVVLYCTSQMKSIGEIIGDSFKAHSLNGNLDVTNLLQTKANLFIKNTKMCAAYWQTNGTIKMWSFAGYAVTKFRILKA